MMMIIMIGNWWWRWRWRWRWHHLQDLRELLLVLHNNQVSSTVGKYIPNYHHHCGGRWSSLWWSWCLSSSSRLSQTSWIILIILRFTCTLLQSWSDKYRKRALQQTRTRCLKQILTLLLSNSPCSDTSTDTDTGVKTLARMVWVAYLVKLEKLPFYSNGKIRPPEKCPRVLALPAIWVFVK